MPSFLFLDVDGVLTTTRSPYEMVPACVARLDSILVETGALLVISSTWRIEGIGSRSSLQIQFKRICREMDGHTERYERIAQRICGATPRLATQRRQDEILLYVKHHPAERFAAVDDWAEEFASPPPPWLVITHPAEGLDEVAHDALVTRLRGTGSRSTEQFRREAPFVGGE